MGKTFRILDLQKQFVIDAGLKNVVEERYKMPVGPWSSDKKLKEVGQWHLLECFQGIEGWAMALLTRVMGVSSSLVLFDGLANLCLCFVVDDRRSACLSS